MPESAHQIREFHLEDSISPERLTSDIAHERAVAIADLLKHNSFKPLNGVPQLPGPYEVSLGLEDQRLRWRIQSMENQKETEWHLSLRPFRRLIRDYFLICESYFQAVKSQDPRKVEAVDMGRRGIHNEGSEQLQELLKEKVEIDFNTARRLFTLICVLHLRQQPMMVDA